MKKFLLLVTLMYVLVEPTAAQDKYLNIGFYNVENLFDTINSPGVDDVEFTSNSAKKWNSQRYAKKLNDLSMVIAQMQGGEIHILGLSEIENRDVIEDLINTTLLKSRNFEIAHFDSPDLRGVDVGMIYDPTVYRLYQSKSININFSTNPTKLTRDVLFTSGIVGKQDTLHVFVAHFPSRRGGKEASESFRMHVAKEIKVKIDSIAIEQPNAHSIVMGDFNDEPHDKSMLWMLKGKRQVENMVPGDLYNLAYALSYKSEGTYCYSDKWQMLDQILISKSLVDSQSLRYVEGSFKIMKEPWMLQGTEAKKYEGYPFRTFAGNLYLGGPSDHLPVSMQLRIQ